jgi:alpha-L-rhamnosidase
MKRLFAAALVVCWIAGASEPAGQATAPRVFAGAPAASWIFPPGTRGNEFGVFHFRHQFELTVRPASFVVHVSADNRYRLFVNGEQVSSGPQRSDLMHWRYETVDLAPQLRSGRNVVAALVWNWGAEKPVAQFSSQTAFLLQGDGPREAVVNSDPEWRVLRDEGYAPIPVRGDVVGGYYAAPPGEAVDAQRYP